MENILGLVFVVLCASSLSDGQQQCVQFCSAIQILQGQCGSPCPSTSTTVLPLTSSSRRPTLRVGLVSFCPEETLMVPIHERCPNNQETPLDLLQRQVVTLLTRRNLIEAGIRNNTLAIPLGTYFMELGKEILAQGGDPTTSSPPNATTNSPPSG